MTILVTGATGRTGGNAAIQLAKKGHKVRALVRNPDKAGALREAGVEIAIGDIGDAAAVGAALQGVDKAVLCLPNGEQQLRLEKGFTDFCKAAGVRHLIKVSSVEAHAHMHAATHQTHYQSEQHIKASGMSWTMVRPSFFFQNFLASAPSIKTQNQFSFPFGEKGAAAFSDSRDVGVFIAHVFSTPGHENRSYDITSPERMTFRQVAEVFSRELGRKIDYVPADPAAYRAYLGKFLKSEWHLDAVCEIFAEIANGYAIDATDTFEKVSGIKPRTLADFIRDHRAAWG